MKNTNRYMVFSKLAAVRTGSLKSLKNAATRQEARDFKSMQVDPSKFAIFDRDAHAIIR